MWILCPASAWLSGLLWLFARETLPDLGWSVVTIVASALLWLLPAITLLRLRSQRCWAALWCWIA